MSEGKRIRVGMIGCGRITDLHQRAYQKEGRASLVAICDRDPVFLAQRAEEWGVEKTYTDYRSMLADREIDAVEICAPTRLHKEMVLAAVAAGKHISVQKPVTLALSEARLLTEACRKAGLVFKICENYVFHPSIRKARALIEAGEIGQPLSLSCRVVGGSGGWPIPAEAWKWRLEDASVAGGTQTFDHGHHIFSSAWYLLGELEKIHGWIHSVDGVLDAPASFHWTYADGLAQGSVQFTVSSDMPISSKYYSNDEWFEIVGTRGVIWISHCTSHLRSDLPPLTLYRDEKLHHFSEIASDWQEGFDGALANFIDAILGVAPALLDGRQGEEILMYALAAQRSHRQERPVYIEELRKERGEGYYFQKRLQTLWARYRPPSWWQGLFGGSVEASECRRLMEALPSRFRKEAILGLDASIFLDIRGTHGGQWTIEIRDGQFSLYEGKRGECGLVIRADDVNWAAILAGKKGVEMAFLQGQLKLEGKAEWALSLKKAFQL
jgi:predicted dehydrogenase/putative sterol carrier protein